MEEEQIVQSQLQPNVDGKIAFLMIFEGDQSILQIQLILLLISYVNF